MISRRNTPQATAAPLTCKDALLESDVFNYGLNDHVHLACVMGRHHDDAYTINYSIKACQLTFKRVH
jgi:hypothetical protein